MRAGVRAGVAVFVGVCMCALLFGYVQPSRAEIRLLWPTPRSDADDGRKFACGGVTYWGPGQPLQLTPVGTHYIYWEETVDRPGSAFRVALSIGNDLGYTFWIRADHIPHNDEGTVPRRYAFPIDIPDIKATNASLQLIQVVKNEPTSNCPCHDTCCGYPATGGRYRGTKNCRMAFHSCANIVIMGSQDPNHFAHTNAGPYGPYTTEVGRWYRSPETFHIHNPNRVLDDVWLLDMETSAPNMTYTPRMADICADPCAGDVCLLMTSYLPSAEVAMALTTGAFLGTLIGLAILWKWGHVLM